jgi:hypothetical protein
MSKKRANYDEVQLPMAPNLSLRGIEKPEEVLKVCLPYLRKQFNEPTLGFTSVDRTARVKRYALCGVNQKIGTAREHYRILPLYMSTSAIYWAGITVDFQFLISSHQLIDAGIIIFKGDAIADKIPVLRAEWHCADEYLQAIHAQPHWHVYYPPKQSRTTGFTADTPTDFGSGENADEAEASEAELMSFHFAMSAVWQRGDMNAHVEAITSETALGGWLCGCLSYIVGELS